MFVFSENLACFVFLFPPFKDSPFCLIPTILRQYYANVELCAMEGFVSLEYL